uniref:ATP synthase F0 subunit 8 n=1 Tax=Drawida ghilarovi TaxID=994964 RepID=UPI0021B5BF01|nr:ATP synthase F0 subunit 8 [Drawida ghilarovi]UIX22928.1 ATP synthase F0 subunit 8 [Drawida ghilarovi]UIX22941.1 ATP synthase F0 subunit 8 [Drawida ghilarovi]
MPHLSPMSWIMTILMFWTIMSIMTSLLWWNKSTNFMKIIITDNMNKTSKSWMW